MTAKEYLQMHDNPATRAKWRRMVLERFDLPEIYEDAPPACLAELVKEKVRGWGLLGIVKFCRALESIITPPGHIIDNTHLIELVALATPAMIVSAALAAIHILSNWSLSQPQP